MRHKYKLLIVISCNNYFIFAKYDFHYQISSIVFQFYKRKDSLFEIEENIKI